MAEKTVPAVEAEPSTDADSKRFSDIELRLLDANAKAKENLNREADQRHNLRRLSVGVGVALMIGMGVMLWHVSHSIFTTSYFEKPSMYIVAALVAPILSMTTVSIALLVAAFRGFKDSDGKNSAAMTAEAARGAGIIN
ncbi:hypothetical protein ACGYK3_13975 [Sulfitobacter sp. 1A05707]|uniref:hypothetical protein n=1 Tax=Sulfitobacter sp. 1A05707 TaxID=3368560 RepID=UPI003745E774